jgi:hypothetical protein
MIVNKLKEIFILQFTAVVTIFWFVLLLFGIASILLPHMATVSYGYMTVMVVVTITMFFLHHKSKGISND